MATIRGRAVVKGADGTVTIAGVAQINTTRNATLTDKSEVKKIKDSSEKVQTLLKPEAIKGVEVEVMPGGTSATAATLTEAKAQGVLPEKLSVLVLSGFPIASFNDSYIIDEDSSVKLDAEGECIVTVRATRYERNFHSDSLTTI